MFILVWYKNENNTYYCLRFKSFLRKRKARFAIYKFVRRKYGNRACKSLKDFEFEYYPIATGLEFNKEDLLERWERFEYLM